MRLGTRIFICYFVIVIGCFAYPIWWILNTLDTRYREGVEDPLVDQANILAALVGLDMEDQQFDPARWHLAFNQAYARPLSAQIYSLIKTHVDLRVYVTDITGKVLFDSQHPENEGSDYSLWRDVHLTLKEKTYGARSTPDYPGDPQSPATLYVAAPIMVRGEIVGALSVSKPSTNINTFLRSAKPQIIKVAGLSGLIAILLSYVVSLWLTRPIQRLTLYADDVRQGKRGTFPKLDRSEIGRMGQAFRKMQEALEGKKYVEQYVQNLTHEIKSPLSAIRGAAELLNEEQMPPERRIRFLGNIRDEANRIQKVVDRMLQLATLENLKMLDVTEVIPFAALVQRAVESKQPLISKKQIVITSQIADNLTVKGDPFLLEQAISNLLQNAVEFSPQQGAIALTVQAEDSRLSLHVDDHGSGIPDYALDKVFDKFFSLQRPDSGKKSTGLGLNFVKEIALLHHGTITLNNRPEGGARATLTLPL